MDSLTLFIRAAAMAMVASWFSLSAAEKRPNVILIMADDFGYECVSANGGQSYSTPVLDKLAKDGVRFEHCYAQPLCTPTRVQLMTGIYNIRNYVQFGYLDPKQTTFAHLFQKAGYSTCIVGKWQLGAGFELPKHFGFDEYSLWQLNRRPERYKNPGLEVNGKEFDYSKGEYGPDLVNDYAIDFVTRKKDAPFFLYYPMMLTHSPHVATPDSSDWDETAGGKRKKKDEGAKDDIARHFGDMTAYMDKLIGKLIAKLDELGIRDNTLIVFTGDNGTGNGVTSQWNGKPFAGRKADPVDAGMHVPLIVNWPALVRSGRVSGDLVDSTDFLPTICAAASIAVPDNLAIDGRSFLPQILGETATPRQWVYCWHSKDGDPTPDAEFARNQSYKLYRDGRFFDVQSGDDDSKLIDAKSMDAASAQARTVLQAALDQFANARPEDIVKQKRKRDKKEN